MARAQIIVLSTVLILGPGVCSAGDYWPVLDGLTYEYVNDQGETLVLSTSYALEGYGEHTTTFEGGCTYQNKYSTDSNGDVLLHTDIYHCPGMFDPYFIWSFNPGVTFIDNPLEVGKTWAPTTTASGYGSYSATFHYEVIGEEVITVPLGTFVVMVVEEWAFLPGGTNRGGVYKLNKDIGPVELPGGFVLTGISGLVSIDQSSWGSVKALYR